LTFRFSGGFFLPFVSTKRKKEKMASQIWLGIDVGVRNLSYCYLQQNVHTRFFSIDIWENKDLLSEFTPHTSFKNMDVMEIHVLAQLILPILFPRQDSRINHVIIEKQPGGMRGGSQKLDMFSQLIFAYFEEWRQNLKFGEVLYSVRIQSAQSKYCATWLQRYGWQKEKQYNRRKALSVKLAQNLIDDYKIQCQGQQPFNMRKKKDDLADAFLLAFYAANFKPTFIDYPPPTPIGIKAQESSWQPQEQQEQQEPQEQPQEQQEQPGQEEKE
jgi:hypothetical protein